jgi:hypothetical protein
MIVTFPYRVSRRAAARRPRRSKNGTPEERAAKAAASAAIVELPGAIKASTQAIPPGREELLAELTEKEAALLRDVESIRQTIAVLKGRQAEAVQS